MEGDLQLQLAMVNRLPRPPCPHWLHLICWPNKLARIYRVSQNKMLVEFWGRGSPDWTSLGHLVPKIRSPNKVLQIMSGSFFWGRMYFHCKFLFDVIRLFCHWFICQMQKFDECIFGGGYYEYFQVFTAFKQYLNKVVMKNIRQSQMWAVWRMKKTRKIWKEPIFRMCCTARSREGQFRGWQYIYLPKGKADWSIIHTK